MASRQLKRALKNDSEGAESCELPESSPGLSESGGRGQDSWHTFQANSLQGSAVHKLSLVVARKVRRSARS